MESPYQKYNLPKRFWAGADLTDTEKRQYKDNFSQVNGKVLDTCVAKIFTPYLRSLGYKGSKDRFYKIEGELIYAVTIKKSEWGGMSLLILGVQPKEVEAFQGFPLAHYRYNADTCLCNKIIYPIEFDPQATATCDGYFLNGRSEFECMETVEIMLSTFKKTQADFFGKFSNFPHPFDKVTSGDVLNDDESDAFKDYGISGRWLRYNPLQWAKVKYLIGQKDVALEIIRHYKNDPGLHFSNDHDLKKDIDVLNTFLYRQSGRLSHPRIYSFDFSGIDSVYLMESDYRDAVVPTKKSIVHDPIVFKKIRELLKQLPKEGNRVMSFVNVPEVDVIGCKYGSSRSCVTFYNGKIKAPNGLFYEGMDDAERIERELYSLVMSCF